MWKITVAYYEGESVAYKVFREAVEMRIVSEGFSLHIEESGERAASFSSYIYAIKERAND